MSQTGSRLGVVLGVAVLAAGGAALVGGIGAFAFRLAQQRTEVQSLATGGNPSPPLSVVSNSDDAEMLRSHLDLMAAATRSLAVGQEIQFWRHNRIDSIFLKDLTDEGDAAFEKMKEIDQRMKNRWGEKLKKLRLLSPRYADKSKKFAENTKQSTEALLDRYNTVMQADIDRAEAQLRVDVPLRLPEIKNIDRSTAQGKLEYEEQEILLPAREKLARAERDEEIARRTLKILPVIIQKWIKKAHEENQVLVSKHEAEFRK